MKCLTRLLVCQVIIVTAVSIFSLLVYFSAAFSNPIILQQTNQFCDLRSVNDVGFGVGKFLTITADLTPDGDLTDPSGDGPPDGFADSDGVSPLSNVVASQDGLNRRLNYFPLPNSPNHFARSIPFNCDDLTEDPDLRDSWNLSISNGNDTLNPVTPDVQGVLHLPFIASFSFEVGSDPTTPLFRWTFPPGSAHDRVTIWIQDLEDFIGQGGVGGGGAARVIFTRRLADNATSFVVPQGISEPNHLYSVSIQLDQLRPQPVNPLFGRLQSRSRAFFSFQTRSLPVNQQVYLPSVDPNGVGPGQPVYQFNVLDVQPGQVIFIDPPVSIGYDYQIGSGDPNFNSVILPEVGNNFYDLYLWNGAEFLFEATVEAGVEHFFSPGGVDRFRILGIEPKAGLDPNDATAFVTGLTFVSAGQFTGTMTPIIGELLLAADLSITKVDSPDPVRVGDEITYRLRVRNLGPSDATGVVVTDTLPANINFVSASSGCSRSGRTVTCKIGNMRNGETAVRLLRVRPTAPGKLSNTATVTANEPDPRPRNNTATTETTVR